MCEASAFMKKEGRMELLMENVDLVVPEGSDRWNLVSLFGEQMTVVGRIDSLRLVEHQLIFAPPDQDH